MTPSDIKNRWNTKPKKYKFQTKKKKKKTCHNKQGLAVGSWREGVSSGVYKTLN